MSTFDKIRGLAPFKTLYEHPVFCYGSLVWALGAYTVIEDVQFSFKNNTEIDALRLFLAFFLNFAAEATSFVNVWVNSCSRTKYEGTPAAPLFSECFIIWSMVLGVAAAIIPLFFNINRDSATGAILNPWPSLAPAITVASLKIIGGVMRCLYKDNSAQNAPSNDAAMRCPTLKIFGFGFPASSFSAKTFAYFAAFPFMCFSVDLFFNPALQADQGSLYGLLSILTLISSLIICRFTSNANEHLNFAHLLALLAVGVTNAITYGNNPPVNGLLEFANYCAPWVFLVPAIAFEWMRYRGKRNAAAAEERMALLGGTAPREPAANEATHRIWCCKRKKPLPVLYPGHEDGLTGMAAVHGGSGL